MKTRIVRIGNSQGIRIPKVLLDEIGLHGEVNLTARNGALIVRPVPGPRVGWAESFQEMARNGDDVLSVDVPPSLSDWDEEEWEW